MAKGVHSKRRKRNQSIKRKILEQKLWGPSLEATSKRLFKRTFGMGDDSMMKMKKNGFRFPNDPEAAIPQAAQPNYIDRRTSAAPREFLIKDQGIKKKNQIKKENKENLDKLLKEAQLRGEGREREEEIIEVDMLEQDEDINQMDFEDSHTVRKNKKKKNEMMDMDMDDNNINRKNTVGRRRRKNKKKSKSHYIINY